MTLVTMPWFNIPDSADPTLFQNMFGMYDFTGNTNDTSGQGNTATSQGGATLTTDRRGTANYAYTFSGASGGWMSTVNSVTNPQVYSINVWFKTTTTNGGALVGFGNVSVGSPSSYDRIVWIDSTGHMNFGAYTGATVAYITSSSTYNDGNWHMATATMSASNGMQLYIDGTSVGTNANKTSQNYTGWWRIGHEPIAGTWPANAGTFFGGTMDDIKIYSVALASTQVTKLYAL